MLPAFKITALVSSLSSRSTERALAPAGAFSKVRGVGSAGMAEWGRGVLASKALTPAMGDLGDGEQPEEMQHGERGVLDRQTKGLWEVGRSGGWIAGVQLFLLFPGGNPASLRESPLILARKQTSLKPKADLGDDRSPAWNKAGSPFGIRRRRWPGWPWASHLPSPVLLAGLELPGCAPGLWAGKRGSRAGNHPGEKPAPSREEASMPNCRPQGGVSREGQAGRAEHTGARESTSSLMRK